MCHFLQESHPAPPLLPALGARAPSSVPHPAQCTPTDHLAWGGDAVSAGWGEGGPSPLYGFIQAPGMLFPPHSGHNINVW